jgi:hypothetical protein
MSSIFHLKNSAIELRRAGKSYSEILKELNLSSKGTLSAWFKNIDLSSKSRRLLKENTELAVKRGLHKFNLERTQKIVEENEVARIEGATMIGKISARELLILGAALYWGEGTKSERTSGNRNLAFANSDPDMIATFLRFIRDIFKVREEKIRAGIHIYPNISMETARGYWSAVTKLPADRFYIVTQVSRASQNKRPYNSLPYGTAVIRVCDRKLFFRVKGMIQGLIENTKFS